MFKSITNFFREKDSPDKESTLFENLNLRKVKNVPAEVIHAEVDNLEKICIDKYLEIFNVTVVPETTKEIRKTDLMLSLGFPETNQEIQKGLTVKDNINTKVVIKEKSSKIYTLINEYKKSYPFDKIIPLSDFKEVLKKYNLVFMPVSCYIRDVPEKNLLEIKNAKPTLNNHSIKEQYVISTISFYSTLSNIEEQQQIARLLNLATQEDLRNAYRRTHAEFTFEKLGIISASQRGKINNIDICVLNTSKLLISAPISHFNTELLNNAEKRYYLNEDIKIVETTDPIAFYLLEGVSDEPIVRIISKWGTEDDQSYLDPAVQNENLN